MKQRIVRALNRTWDVIGSDCLDSFEEKNPTMPRAHVAEVVCDAGHMRMYGGDEEAVKIFEKLKYGGDAWNKLIKEAFPYKSYGW